MDEHIKGHFILCYLAICTIRYLQYLLRTKHDTEMSAERIMDVISDPKAVAMADIPESFLFRRISVRTSSSSLISWD